MYKVPNRFGYQLVKLNLQPLVILPKDRVSTRLVICFKLFPFDLHVTKHYK